MAAPYRDDQDALMTRLTGLLDELGSLRARTSELRDMERSEQRIERDIAEVRKKLARIAPTRLPLLDRVSVAAPCPADWDAMTGDERSRFCAACQKHVYNIAGMSAEEAEAFLRNAGGEACIRIFRRADGTVLTSDCPVGVRRRRRRRAVASVVGGGLLSASALLFVARPATGKAAMVINPTPTATTPEPMVDPIPAMTAVPSAEPTPHMVTAGRMLRPTQQSRLESELSHVKNLLDKRSQTSDPAQRRLLEQEIRTSSQRVIQLSPPPPPSTKKLAVPEDL